MKQEIFRGIRPDDLGGRMGLKNPERGFRTEVYASTIPGETAGTCSCACTAAYASFPRSTPT